MHGLVKCTHWVQVFTHTRWGCDNHRCHNNPPPDRKCDWGCEWRHARKRWAEDFGIWKKTKTVSWDLDLDEASWFSELAKARSVWVDELPAHWLSQWVQSWQCTNSQHSKKLCVSLSLLMSENLKLKKVNKSFVPETKESRQVFRVFSDSYTSKNIMNILWTCVHFTYS